MFFFDSKKEPRQSRADAKNYSFFCKKRKQKNINNRNLKLNNYGLGNFLKFTLFSNGNYIPLIQNIKFYLYSLFNNFEIISLLDYGFCYNYGFNHNENNLKNYNPSVNENYNFAFGENCNFVKSFNYDFVNIESKNYNLSKIGNYNSLNGSCYGFWRIYFICDNLKDFLFNTKNQKKF